MKNGIEKKNPDKPAPANDKTKANADNKKGKASDENGIDVKKTDKTATDKTVANIDNKTGKASDESVPEPDKEALRELFGAFAKFGDKKADGKTIKLSQSDKWFKQAKVIEGKKMSTTDTGIAFRKIGK